MLLAHLQNLKRINDNVFLIHTKMHNHRGKLGNGERWGMANRVISCRRGKKAIKCFHPWMLTPLMARVNTNKMELSYHSLS